MFVGIRLGRGCWVGVTIIASGLLDFRRCCALINHEIGRYHPVGIIPICSVSSDGRGCLVVPFFHDCLRLLVLAGMHPVYLVGLLSESFVQQPYAC